MGELLVKIFFALDFLLNFALTFPDPATMRIYNERASWSGTCYFGASAKALHAVADLQRLITVSPGGTRRQDVSFDF